MNLRPYTKVTLAYLLFGTLWILFSDWLVALIWTDAADVTRVQTLKGWFYVAVTAFLIHSLSRATFRRQVQIEAEKLSIFSKTIEGVYHILRNYLNQMQLVTMEAKDCPEFDPLILTKAETLTERATRELDTLGALASAESISGEHIDSAIYRSLRERADHGKSVSEE